MAPYTMTIDIYNDTDARLDWIGISKYQKLDGPTNVVEHTEFIEPGKKGRVKISKSGGTDGLFAIVSYNFPRRCTSVNSYALMPASAFSKATVKFVDHSAMNQPQLKDLGPKGGESAATWWYDKAQDKMMDGPWSSNVIELNGGSFKTHPDHEQEVWRITRTLTRDKMEYPNASCTVRVTSKSLGQKKWDTVKND